MVSGPRVTMVAASSTAFRAKYGSYLPWRSSAVQPSVHRRGVTDGYDWLAEVEIDLFIHYLLVIY